MKKLAISMAVIVAASAGGWWTDGKHKHSVSEPIDLKKYPYANMYCWADDKKLPSLVKTKVVIEQENPCLTLYEGNFEHYGKIDDNTAEITDVSEHSGFEMSADDGSGDIVLLGEKGCRQKGREHWKVYQLIGGKWEKVCETTFRFK